MQEGYEKSPITILCSDYINTSYSLKITIFALKGNGKGFIAAFIKLTLSIWDKSK